MKPEQVDLFEKSEPRQTKPASPKKRRRKRSRLPSLETEKDTENEGIRMPYKDD